MLYRALMRMYPRSFRQEYGESMAAMFSERWAQASVAGRVGLVMSAVPETLGNALLVHWELLRQDVRYAARMLRRSPGFTLTAVLVIALGIGANTAAFSVADFVLVRPLSFPEPETLVRLCEGPRNQPAGWGCNNQLSPANYRDFREQTTSFAKMGAFRRDAVNLVGGGEPQRVGSGVLTDEVFELLRVPAFLGTTFNSRTADQRVVVLSYGLWQSRFGADMSVLGRSVSLDGAPHVVIGVMPRTFSFPSRDAALWVPMRFMESDYENRNNSYIEGIARLREGVTFERARADLDVIVERLANTYAENEETGISFFRLRDEYAPRYRLMLQALCGASLCILLLACANLANLLLARAAARERELAVRSALGAGRDRLVRQMITESVALAVIGGGAGVLLTLLLFPLLSVLVPPTLSVGSQPTLNLRALGFAGLFTLLTGLAVGLFPALRASSRAALTTLRGRSGRPTRRVRSLLVAIEVAASVVLLIGAGLLMRAMLRVNEVEPGFREQGVLTLRTVLPKPKYDSAQKREAFYGAVLREVRALPGVSSAGFTTSLPMVLTGGIARVTLPGQEVRPDGQYAVSRRYISPQFFSAMGIPLLRGRDFLDTDIAAADRVAVVSESFAKRYWPESDPLGRAFLFRDEEWRVIGVVGNVKVRGLEREAEPQLYLPGSTVPETPFTFYDPKDLVIRVAGDELAILPAVREIVRKADPEQPISDIQTLSDLLGAQVAPRRAQVQVLGALALIALLLVGVGINGLLAYTVAQQQPEIGVRLALGAEPGQIARKVLFEGLSIVACGLLPGLLIALWAARSLQALLFGVPSADPLTIGITVTLCLAMSVTGALLPALRAVRVSPMSVMRTE